MIEGTKKARLGVLVRRAWEMKKEVEKSDAGHVGVFLTQEASQNHIGTGYSASTLFDLALGQAFTVENRSNTGTDVMVYSDPEL